MNYDDLDQPLIARLARDNSAAQLRQAKLDAMTLAADLNELAEQAAIDGDLDAARAYRRTAGAHQNRATHLAEAQHIAAKAERLLAAKAAR